MRHGLRMKKGFFFSLMTFMLLFSIFLFSADYITRSKQLQNSLADSRISNKMVYIEDDIIHGALEELAGIRVNSITRLPSSILLNFSGGVLMDVNYSARAEKYMRFVSDNYSVLSNAQISLENFTSGFYVSPFDSRYLLEGRKASLLSSHQMVLEGISIVVTLNVSKSQLVFNSTPPGSGSKDLHIRVFDVYGADIINETLSLDPSLINKPFLLGFNDGSEFEARFGNYLNNGSLLLNATGLSASLDEIVVTYAYSSEKVSASNGFLRLYSPLGRIGKERDIILKEE